MSKVEKELIDRFGHEEMDNDNFDTLGLWNDIEREISSDKGRKPLMWWWIGSAMLVATGIAVLYIADNTKSNPYTISKILEVKKTVAGQNQSSKIISAEKIEQIFEEEEVGNSHIKESEKIFSDATESSKTENIDRKIDALIEEKIALTKKSKGEIYSDHPTQNTSEREDDIIDGNLTKSKIEFAKKQDDLKIVKNIIGFPLMLSDTVEVQSLAKVFDFRTNWEIETMLSLKFTSLKNESDKKLKLLKNIDNENQIKRNPSAINIGMFTGLNLQSHQYDGKEETSYYENKSATESNSLGHSFGLTVGIQLTNNISLNSGIEYHDFWTKFKFKDIKNEQALLPNQLLSVTINSHTGDTISYNYGEALVGTIVERKIVHHNKFRQITVPLELGFHKRYNRFIFGMNAGLTANFIIKQEGRTTDLEGSVIDYTANTKDVAVNDFSIGYRLKPDIGFVILDGLELHLISGFGLQRHALLGDGSGNTLVKQTTLNLGIVKGF